jgi:sugar lactone lactonase YvrE/ribosomal protein L24E
MHSFKIVRRVAGTGTALLLGVALSGVGATLSAGPASAASIQTIATGLNSPRHLTVGPDGALYVAEAGTGGPGPTGSNCVATVNEAHAATTDCLGTTGSIARITTGGVVTTALAGLPSIVTEPAGGLPAEYIGPASTAYVNGKLEVVTEVQDLNSDGTNKFGAAGTNLGQLITAAPGSAASTWSVGGTNFAAYAAAHPQGSSSLGTGAGESATDSDPYALTPYNGGFAVADAAANDLLWVSSTGTISQLATFPAQSGTSAQAVPTSVAVGPDGALYVGELVGAPSTPGSAVVYRVVPGQSPTVYATGFSAITDVAFDRDGRLLVLEYDTKGLLDTTGASGAVIRVNQDGSQTTLASTGLTEPTGLAVGPNGSIYVSNNGDTAAGGSIVEIPVTAQDGYQETAADGGTFDFGHYSFVGSLGGVKLVKPIVSAASTRIAPGYWAVASDGGVFAFGADSFYGSLGGVKLAAPIVGMASTPDGRGYWLVASDGGVFTFGDAQFFGSEGGKPLNKPVVGIAATPDGGGYWLVASDGGVFSFGNAKFFGSEGGTPLVKPVVGIAATPDGAGYWEVASDGGIFAFGDASFLGSEGGTPLVKPVVGIQATPDGAGYWEVASDGGIFTFGNADFFGSEGGQRLDAPVVGLS